MECLLRVYMDPAAGIFSPFHIEGGGKNGILESAVEALGTASRDADAVSVSQRDSTKKNSSSNNNNNKVKENDSSRRGTPCGSCGSVYTTITVPTGGMYLCTECAAEHEANPKPYSFPPNTLKCCPASVTEGSDGVVRCYACHGWYHFACLEIHDKALKDYLALSTTKWYCPEPSCCENVLQEKLKKKRREYKSRGNNSLQSVDQPLHFTRRAPTEAHDVISQSEINSLLDWYVIRGVNDVQFRLALLLQPENTTISEYTDPSLVVVSDVSSQCRTISSSSTSDAGNTASVTVFTSFNAVHLLYICDDDAYGVLHVLVAQWRDGNLSVSVDETLMSLSMAKSWLLPRDVGAANILLVYVLGIDGATSMILLEGMNSLVAHPSSITRMKLPHKLLVGETELVTSCFLPSVEVTGLVRYLRSDGTFIFELYRFFSHEQSAELLLETSTAIFTDLSVEERQYCSLSSRVAFTDCRLTLVGLESLQVDIAVTAILKSPTAGGLQDFGGWVKCGETILTGRAIIKDSGRRVLVSPLRRTQFRSLVSREDINDTEGKIRGRMGRCIFDQNDSKLNCGVTERPHYTNVRGVSRRCSSTQMWWQPTTVISVPDRYLCKYLGIGITEVLTFSFIFFTAAFGIQFAAQMLPIWVGNLG